MTTLTSFLAQAVDAIWEVQCPELHPLVKPTHSTVRNSREAFNFHLHARLNFQERPDLFSELNLKGVNYMCPALKRIPLECFEPALLDPVEPPWLRFDLFPQELQNEFWSLRSRRRSRRPKRTGDLRMQENHQANEILQHQFTQLATRVLVGQQRFRDRLTKDLPNISR